MRPKLGMVRRGSERGSNQYIIKTCIEDRPLVLLNQLNTDLDEQICSVDIPMESIQVQIMVFSYCSISTSQQVVNLGSN